MCGLKRRHVKAVKDNISAKKSHLIASQCILTHDEEQSV